VAGGEVTHESVVVLLGGRDNATRAVYHSLEKALEGRAKVWALLEQPPSRLSLARRRSRKLGWRSVAGQVAFVALVMPILERTGRRRVREIATEHHLDFGPIEGAVPIKSVNDEQSVALLKDLDPSIVVVHGTRLIAAPVLASLAVPWINVHAGITPRYRGVHGGFWALTEGRSDLVGTTVHLVDAGIDTGAILGQATFETTRRDNLATYPYLHLASGLPVLNDRVAALLRGESPAVLPTLAGAERSCLRWHPTAWNYLVGRARRGVR
jgi:folate-dependent phosphoribosylglycinamide formyltransferase PurN